LQLGHVLKLQGRMDEARVAYRRALALDPSRQHAAAELWALGENDSVPANEPQCDGKAPRANRRRGKPSIITRADRARDLGEWVIAGRLYRKALYRNPHNAAIWVQYGHTLKEAGQLLDAERAFCRALLIDATLADCHLHLGHVFRAQRKTQAAC